jgi:hypothetical protein
MYEEIGSYTQENGGATVTTTLIFRHRNRDDYKGRMMGIKKYVLARRTVTVRPDSEPVIAESRFRDYDDPAIMLTGLHDSELNQMDGQHPLLLAVRGLYSKRAENRNYLSERQQQLTVLADLYTERLTCEVAAAGLALDMTDPAVQKIRNRLQQECAAERKRLMAEVEQYPDMDDDTERAYRNHVSAIVAAFEATDTEDDHV